MGHPCSGYKLLIVAAWLLCHVGIPRQGLAGFSLADQVQEHLRNRVATAGVPPELSVAGERLRAGEPLALFYEQRAYQPTWSEAGRLSSHIDAVLTVLRTADRDGLRPADYHLAAIERTLRLLRVTTAQVESYDAAQLAELDLLLTDAVLLYISHALAGRLDPESVKAGCLAEKEPIDSAAVLHTTLTANDVGAALQLLLPRDPGYDRLRQALARYRVIASHGGWPIVPDGPKMEKGERGGRVLRLRSRLRAEGLLNQEPRRDRDLFDDGLARAVRTFQRRHGLVVDGIVGPATLAALNVPTDARVRQIELSLERWRWLPRDLGQRYILVNIAAFALHVVESGHPVLNMRVVVGKPFSCTPIFSATVTHLVFNPSWYVPRSIAVREMLPRIRKNPAYVGENDIVVTQRFDGKVRAVNPSTINWSQISANNFPYRFRQRPGPKNPLGRVKFMFPNHFNVYLHDTPSRELFARTVRAFSHGCIRIEKPLELAEYLLQGDAQWTHDKILATIEQGAERTVWLPEGIPVHLLYLTAWVDEDGVVHFRDDIYGRDRLLAETLGQELPAL